MTDQPITDREAGALEATAKAVGMLSDTYRERAFLVALLAAEYPSVWAPDKSAAGRLRTMLARNPTLIELNELGVSDLLAVLAERDQLAARVAELEAERVQDTRAVIDIVRSIERRLLGGISPADELRNHFGNRDARLAPPQPERSSCCGGPHAGWIHTAECSTPQQPERKAMPTCGYPPCDDPDHQRDTADGGATAAFEAAQRRYRAAIAEAPNAPTYAAAVDAANAAIDDYNRAVDAYNAANGLDGKDDALVYLPPFEEGKRG